ncbi:transposase [Reticulibacter mediterranei]|uniref:transposase n=1 Tax=Reticulibacter mediterranei TaxID=2778369 RepID=UPI0022A83624
MRRCQIMLASARGERVPKIALQLGCDDQTVRNVIHSFNATGLSVLEKGSSCPHRLRVTFSQEAAQQIKQEGKGVRSLLLYLPKQSPWLNPIEPKWAYAKRNVVESHALFLKRSRDSAINPR